MESTIFFAFHSSGVIELILPCLYCVISDLACSRPVLEVRRVLVLWVSAWSVVANVAAKAWR